MKKETPRARLFKDFTVTLDFAAKVSAASAPFMLVCAMVFNYVFWMIIDPQIFELMTLSDYITTAMGVLPVFAISFAGVFVVFGLIRVSPVPKLAAKLPVHHHSPSRRRSSVFTLLFSTLLTSAALGLIAWWVSDLSTRVHLLMFAGILLLLGGMIGWVIPTSEDDPRAVAIMAICAFALFGIMVMSASLGGMSAANLKSGVQTVTHELKLNDGRVIAHAASVRAFNQGLFVLDLDGMVPRFIVWSEVKELQPN